MAGRGTGYPDTHCLPSWPAGQLDFYNNNNNNNKLLLKSHKLEFRGTQ